MLGRALRLRGSVKTPLLRYRLRRSRDLRFNLTPRLLEKIGHAYAADMHHFGYSLDPARIPCALHDDGEAARARGDPDALARASERKERRLPPRSFRDRQKGGLGLGSRMRTLS